MSDDEERAQLADLHASKNVLSYTQSKHQRAGIPPLPVEQHDLVIVCLAGFLLPEARAVFVTS